MGKLEATSDLVDLSLISVIDLGVYMGPKLERERNNARIYIEAVKKKMQNSAVASVMWDLGA